ncbi:MAG: ATP synthase F1 subunit delta [Deltaproteobacteria bacterium]|nr:ATP synthase F1 subunit delta [Deltaproteobacteria bacterium]
MIGSKVSKRYAKALFSLAQEDGKIPAYGEDLKGFVKIFRDHPELARVVSSPVFTVEDRKSILEKVLVSTPLSSLVRNFLHLLLDRGRIGVVGSIQEHYEKLADEISNLARAEVIVARPLQADARARLERALGDLTSKTIKMKVREDRGLIGGIVVRIGDLVLDGSIKTHLRGLREPR